jgi:uncharacterized protein YukE
MRGCDPTMIAAKLEMALEALNHARSQVASQWDDSTHRSFDEQFLVPVEPKVKRALEAIRHLAESIAKAERECSE